MIAGFWVLLIFGLSQVIRLGSNLVVTRLLMPEMFGVMAVVGVITFGLEMFSDLGFWAFVVRHKNPEDSHMLNVVWTMQVIRGWVMFTFVLLITIALFFGQKYFPNFFQSVYADSRLPFLIFIAGTASVINAYKSLASPILSRKLERRKLELGDLAAQIIGTSIMVIWVWFLPSIWALVSATVISAFISLILSYRLFPYRHRFAWDKTVVAEVMHFGKWIVISSILTYISMQGDRLFLASAISANELGVYSIAFMLVSSVISIAYTLVVKVFFPVLTSAANNQRHLLKQKYYQIRHHLDIYMFLAVGLLIALAPFIVNFLYDDRYKNAGWMLQILAFSVIGNTLATLSLECLSALAITKVNMWVMAIRSIAIFVGLPVVYKFFGLNGVIWAISLNVWLGLPIIYWSLAKNALFSWFDEVKFLPLILVGYVIGKGFLLLIHNL